MDRIGCDQLAKLNCESDFWLCPHCDNDPTCQWIPENVGVTLELIWYRPFGFAPSTPTCLQNTATC